MIEGLTDKHFVDVARSVFVGDSESDRAAAASAGVGEFIVAAEFFARKA
jgi:histidinol phosphatase-like enzyme